MTGDTLRLVPFGFMLRGQIFPAQIGRSGLTRDKHEGDGATPIGPLRITATLYRADRLPRPAPWARPIGPGDLWCDAPDNPAYNQLVHTPFSASHERLFRADPLYDIILVTDWNTAPALPGKGSAIFLHQRRRLGYPTAGCIALRRADLITLARLIRPGTRLIIPDNANFLGARRPDTPQGL